MNVILKILSTLLIVVGVIYMYLFLILNGGGDKLSAFTRPSYSYYETQNLTFVFILGAIIVVISMIAAFMAFNRKMMQKEEVLENASHVDQDTIKTWVQGSSLDTTIASGNDNEAGATSIHEGDTEILVQMGGDTCEE